MEETDVGRLLAAAAPETVPPVGGLAERARAAGRRQRRRRTVMTGGGAGIALAGVVGAVIGIGGLGGSGGPRGGQQPLVSSKPIATPSSSDPTSSAPSSPAAPSPTKPTKPTLAKGQAIDDPVADAKVLAAVKAALPAKYRDTLTLYRADGMATTYGAEFTMGQERTFDVSVAVITPELPGGTPTQCQADIKHCTVGTATLQGHPVTWQYYYGDLSNPNINVYDYKAMVDYVVSVTGPTPSRLPGLTELKDVGLNEQVAAALLAAWPGAPK